jgi:hypothetical protein
MRAGADLSGALIENDSANETFSLSLREKDRTRAQVESFIPHPSPLPEGEGDRMFLYPDHNQ